MLPKDVIERFFDGPLQYEELRNRVSAYVGEKLAGQDANGGAQTMDIGQIDKSEGEDEDVNAVQQRRPHDRSNQKHKQESPTTCENRSTVGLPTRHHQRHANRLDETRNRGVMRRNGVRARKNVSFATRCGGKGHPARLCPSGSGCQDVDEVGTEPSSDLFGLDWGDDPIATINSVTERNDRTRGGKELLAFFDSGAVDNVLPRSSMYRVPLEATPKSQSGVGFEGANGSHIKHHGQRRFRVKTSAGSNMNTTWKSRMCASR